MADEDDAAPVGADDDIPNAATKAGVRKQRKKVQSRETEAGNFWRAVFADKIGRREMYGILQSGDAFGERYEVTPAGHPDPFLTGRHAGEQRLAFRLYLSWLKLDPEGVALMLRENDPLLVTAEKSRSG